MHVSPQALAESVGSLVRIPSVNPLHAGPRALELGAIGERPIAEHLAQRFDELGAIDVVLDEVVDQRPNVYGVFPGRSKRLVVLDVHSDTVTVEHMTDPPFDGRVDDRSVWGRGALDTKASMGVMLALLERWRHDGLRPHPTLLLIGTAGEEAGGLLGATRFRSWAEQHHHQIDQLVVAEPTRLAPIHGHKGGVVLTITAIGRAAHSALPHLGENAVEAMAPVIAALQDEHRRLTSIAPETELGTATLTITGIEGGTAGNVVPDRCTITIGRRSIPGEEPEAVFGRIEQIARAACPLPVELIALYPTPEGRPGSPAFYQPPDTRLVRTLSEASGVGPAVAPFGSNALRYIDLASEMAVFGPGSIDDAHGATECVPIADLVTLAAAYERWLEPH
jgi:acetylornithine deacetylase/succinyl-diaminopimelate desuccinylase-like protein